MKIKKSLYTVICAVLLVTCNSTDPSINNFDEYYEKDAPQAVLRTVPFSRGVNFSGWFESGSAQEIPFTQYVEQDFADLKSLGADVIRLPILMHNMTFGPPDFTFDPLLLKFLDFAVDWAEKYELYLIIDNHSFDPVKPLADDVDGILLSVWKQIAERYKNRSDYIIYEILNEPHGINDKLWGEIQGKAIDTIRSIDHNPNRLIIVGGTDFNSIGKLSALPEYSDQNLIYTFHYYDPFMFTHQGAGWGDPLMTHLKDIPFPYDKQRMPKTPKELRGTWYETLMRNYSKDIAPKKLFAPLDAAVAFSLKRNVPVFCGEFGVYIINSPNEDRVRWYEIITAALDRRNIPRTSWDYFGGFGIFSKGGGRDFNSDLNVGVVRALGFTPPTQQPKEMKLLESGFTIFNDYPVREFAVGHWGDGDFSMYDTSPYEGEYCIRWSNPTQYNAFWIQFGRSGDFSYLADSGYSLEFKARTEQAVSFDVRFMNYENDESIPWRNTYTVDEKILPPDGKWHTIRIPLNEMKEQGAWVSAAEQWLNPEGKFSWKSIEQLQFATEAGGLPNCTFWIDVIQITAP